MLFGGIYELWPDPLVVGAMGVKELDHALSQPGVEVVLYWPAWNWTLRTIPALLEAKWRAIRLRKRLIFMVNSIPQQRLLRRFGLTAHLASLNCFVDENVFRIESSPKRFDALYIAQMLPVKRMFLARDIPSIYVVTYGECRDQAGGYDLHRFEPTLAHANFNRGWLGAAQIARLINECRVNLALSAEEGAMLAVVEGLLCGVPLVSTPCRGGRELFFDSRFVEIADPTPQAVAAAVSRLSRADVPRELIRRETLRRLQAHRTAVGNVVAGAVGDLRGSPVMEGDVSARFFGGKGTAAHFIGF
jgi:glycosyltransferase involved in cell wall biosynthesis